jgi:hypothetical protein
VKALVQCWYTGHAVASSSPRPAPPAVDVSCLPAGEKLARAIEAESIRLADGWSIRWMTIATSNNDDIHDVLAEFAVIGPGGASGRLILRLHFGDPAPPKTCAQVAARPDYAGGTCAPQKDGDLLLTRRAARPTDTNEVIDFRPDGTWVSVRCEPDQPIPPTRLVGFARDRELTRR